MQCSYWINFQQILHHSTFMICPTLPYCLFWLSGVAFSDYCQAEREQKPETGTQVQASLWAASLSPCFSGRPRNSPYLEENLHVAQVLECIFLLAEQGKREAGGTFSCALPKPHTESVPFKMKAYFLLLYKVPYKEGKTCFLCYLLLLYHLEGDLGSEDLHSTLLHHRC